jgi:hypothetical protein
MAHPTQTALYHLPSSNKVLPRNNLAEAVVSMVWLLCQPFSFPLALLLLFLVPHLLFCKASENFLVYLEGTLYLTLIESGRDIMPIYRCNIPPTLEE